MNKFYGLMIMVFMLIPSLSFANPSNAEVFIVENDGKKSDPIRLEMLVVHATTSNTAVDPQVRPLMKYFRNYKFTGFSLLDSQNSKLNDKTARTFLIEGNRKVTVSLLSHTDKNARLKVIIIEGKGKVF